MITRRDGEAVHIGGARVVVHVQPRHAQVKLVIEDAEVPVVREELLERDAQARRQARA